MYRESMAAIRNYNFHFQLSIWFDNQKGVHLQNYGNFNWRPVDRINIQANSPNFNLLIY